MKKTAKLLCLAGALLVSTSAFAVTEKTAQTVDGKQVSSLKFDREQVTIVYADGTEETVDETKIMWTAVTGIETINADRDGAREGDGVYDLQGRRVSSDELTPGIYIERRAGKSVKIIKK